MCGLTNGVSCCIAPKQETVIQVELTAIQKKYYRAIFEKNLKFLHKGTNMPNLNNIAMELRKCCIHPFLIKGVRLWSGVWWDGLCAILARFPHQRYVSRRCSVFNRLMCVIS